MATSAIKAHATTAPITGPAIHALEDPPCDESLLWAATVAAVAVVAVADGPELNPVLLAVESVVVPVEPVVVVVAVVVAGV
jgi:hypothetical protein